MSETLILKAEFGTAPVGCETVATESFWNDHGYKETYEYMDLASEFVTVDSEWAEWKSIVGFVSTLEMMSPVWVVRFTISSSNGDFTATAWCRQPEAVKYLNDFLSGR